jgi:hypothetical protein
MVVAQVAQRLGLDQVIASLDGRLQRRREQGSRRRRVSAQVVRDQPSVEGGRRPAPPVRRGSTQSVGPPRQVFDNSEIPPVRPEPRQAVRPEQLGRVVVPEPEELQVKGQRRIGRGGRHGRRRTRQGRRTTIRSAPEIVIDGHLGLGYGEHRPLGVVRTRGQREQRSGLGPAARQGQRTGGLGQRTGGDLCHDGIRSVGGVMLYTAYSSSR